MKLKSSLLLMGALTSSVTAMSCANAGNEFRVDKFYPLGPSCDVTTFSENSVIGNGYLDVAAGSPTVTVGVRLSGAERVQQQPVIVGQTQLEGPNRNQPVVTTMVVNYRLSKRVGGTPKPYVTNYTLPFSDGEILAQAQLLSPELGQALFDNLLPSPGTAPSNTIEDFVDIQMDVEFRGEWSATRNTFTTGVFTYPVRAYKSNPGECPFVDNNNQALGRLPFFKYNVDPTTGGVDICTYTGFNSHQLAAPPVPTCCAARGGPGC